MRYLFFAIALSLSCALPANAQIKLPPTWKHNNPKPSLITQKASVACVSKLASDVGAAIMKRGGNAIDAAIAVGFMLAVVYPEAGNIGGGGFMLIRLNNGETTALDYRETAPEKAFREMYLNKNTSSLVGSMGAGVPGTVKGFYEAHQRYGRLPWADLVYPAIVVAQEGFAVNDYMRFSLNRSKKQLLQFSETKKILFPQGDTPQVGDTIQQRDLAETLRQIALSGSDGF
jgi:gamma-glutamyltranspeptidase / glutathione hydrolase